MKRKDNLYENVYKKENVEKCFNEVCRNTKNKRRVYEAKSNKTIMTGKIINTLKNCSYVVGKYNRFIIYEPKKREIVSQGIFDKIINHLVAREIIYPCINDCMEDFNVSSRKGMGVSKARRLFQDARRYYGSKYNEYYILKCDISKFFMSIDHEILKKKFRRKCKDKKALNIVEKIIDSNENGLGIGSLTSQMLAIFYLTDFDHFIKEKLHIKYVIRYQDDFLLFSESKEYLKYCYCEIEKFLEKEKLKLNPKTRIYKSTDNFIFIGYNKYGKYAKYRDAKRRIKKRKHLYFNNKITMNQLINSMINIENLMGKEIYNENVNIKMYKKGKINMCTKSCEKITHFT